MWCDFKVRDVPYIKARTRSAPFGHMLLSKCDRMSAKNTVARHGISALAGALLKPNLLSSYQAHSRAVIFLTITEDSFFITYFIPPIPRITDMKELI